MESVLYSLLDLFFPRVCACERKVLHSKGTYICDTCFQAFDHTRFEDLVANELSARFSKDLPLLGAYAAFWFHKQGTLQRHIFGLKYARQARIGEHLGRYLAAQLRYFPQEAVLVPVPLHPRRQHKRGYNQADFIAKGIQKETGLTVANKLVVRSRNTVSQTGLNRQQRKENVADLFRVKGPAPKVAWIVDDVITTGATTEAVAHALLAAGTEQLFITSVAIAAD